MLSELFIGPSQICDDEGQQRHFISKRAGCFTVHLRGFDASGDPWLPEEVSFTWAESLGELHQL